MAYVNKDKSKAVKKALEAAFPKSEGWVFSVSIEHHTTLKVAIMQAPINMIETDDEYDRARNYQNFNVYHLHNYANREILEKIHKIANEGNFDHSDSQTDYFHVGFYLDITAGKWNKPFVHVPAQVEAAAAPAARETAATVEVVAQVAEVIEPAAIAVPADEVCADCGHHMEFHFEGLSCEATEAGHQCNCPEFAPKVAQGAPEAAEPGNMTLEQFLIEIGDQKFVENGCEFDPEFGETIHYSQKVSAREIFDAVEHYANRFNYEFFTSGQILDLYRETIENGELLTEAEAEKKKMNQRRERLESAAQQIAQGCGLKVASSEFVDHLYSIRAGIRDEREGMREDGLCGGFGMNAEQWFDDRNYLSGKINEVDELIDWLDEFCPLFMMRYREEKAAAEIAEKAQATRADRIF